MSFRFPQALRWQQARSAHVIIREREEMISSLELAGRNSKASGRCKAWFRDSDNIMRGVSSTVNGFLFSELLVSARHCDAGCAERFRKGASVLGKLELSGVGTPTEVVDINDCAAVKIEKEERNKRLMGELKCDEFADELLEQPRADAAMGRMSPPVPLSSFQGWWSFLCFYGRKRVLLR